LSSAASWFEKDIFLAFRDGKRYTSFDGCFPVFLFFYSFILAKRTAV
jgi:hypothetical protein